MIEFNMPPMTGKELKYIKEAINKNNKISGDGKFTGKCNTWFEKNFDCRQVMLTTSGTHALELAALLIDINANDEIIMPSYTFPSTANAFILRGAKIVFVDIRPDTMNIDEKLIENAITKKTKAIVVVHYAGVSCEMNEIMEIANRNNLYVIEDAAQAVMSKYEGKMLGTIGHIGCYSFHESKNYTMGEGGAILLNDNNFSARAEIIREKGTNRSQFFRGEINKYTWVDIGSSYLPSEMNAAYLYAQLENADMINKDRLKSWELYYSLLRLLKDKQVIELPHIPESCKHNAHMFYIKCKNDNERTELIQYLRENAIASAFHYIPLHSSIAGRKFSYFSGEDKFTTIESQRLLRLPMYFGLSERDIRYICTKVIEFYGY